jgi:hypothetical protein
VGSNPTPSAKTSSKAIRRLIAKGHNVDDAEDFLSALTNALNAFERHRLLILDRLRR